MHTLYIYIYIYIRMKVALAAKRQNGKWTSPRDGKHGERKTTHTEGTATHCPKYDDNVRSELLPSQEQKDFRSCCPSTPTVIFPVQSCSKSDDSPEGKQRRRLFFLSGRVKTWLE